MDQQLERVSRRMLLGGLGGGAVAIGALAAPGLPLSLLDSREGAQLPNWWDRQYWSLESAGITQWQRQIGLLFYMMGNEAARWMRVVAVDALPSEGARPSEAWRKTAFAVTFEAGGPIRFTGDRIYTVLNARYSRMQIFLARTAERRMQAVFN